MGKKYKMLPVDEETYQRVITLALAKGYGLRGQGILVRTLVNAEFEKFASVKLLNVARPDAQELPAVDSVA